MKKRTFRRRGVLCTASATRVIVSSTHNPHRQRPSLSGSSLPMITSCSGEMPVLGSPWLMARKQARAIRRQILHGAVARRDDGREVVGPEGFNGGGGNPSRDDRGLLHGDRPIHQDDDQAPVLLTDLIRDDVGRHLVGPHRLGRTRARGELHWRERADGCRDAVVEHGEIRRGQPAHGLALVVEDGHIELDELDAGAKLGQVALSLRQQTHRRQDEERNQAESGHTHRYSSNLEDLWVAGWRA